MDLDKRTHVEAISIGASAAFHGRYLNPYRNHMETIVETMDMKDMSHKKRRKCDEILGYMRNVVCKYIYMYKISKNIYLYSTHSATLMTSMSDELQANSGRSTWLAANHFELYALTMKKEQEDMRVQKCIIPA